jgi:CheY-like chemotaxis protein/nitrogen-specific signal transduction histidine kinase
VEAEQEKLDQRLRAQQFLLQERNVELQGAKAAAEKANRSKSDFLSSMSHELRSPLNAILGFAQLMQTDSPPPSGDQKESISQILQAGRHLLKLINEILDLARIESGKLALSLEPVSLAAILTECRGMVEGLAQKRGIGISLPEAGGHCHVHADRTRLKQVLINLLTNAIKYNREGGGVRVTCGKAEHGRIRVRIEDTGAGLAAGELAQLFQPFNRLGQEAGSEEGTGIGLVVAKQLVELMGGDIGAQSTVGEGSVFWFELAVAEEQLAADEHGIESQRRSPPAGGAQVRQVLYVEDNPANLALVRKLVSRRADLRLSCAVTGRLGIALARRDLPEVVLMDINLPDISGIDALAILRGHPATAHIPVVAISANAMPHDIEKGLQAGFLRYLTKPIDIDEFARTLDLALDAATHTHQTTHANRERIP